MFTKADLKEQLKKLGVPNDRPVTVHTSLKAIGEVEGGGETVLQALIDCVTENGGLLMIPTHTWDRREKFPTMDMITGETCIGINRRIKIKRREGK